MGKIAIIGTLDTKESEAFFLKDRISKLGHEGLVFDVSLKKSTPKNNPDISQDQLLKKIQNQQIDLDQESRERASNLMEIGLGKKLRDMQENEKIQGAIGYGGSVGSGLITGGLTYLPTSFPKFIITTVPNIVREYVDKNIGILPSPVDFINGENLNLLEKKVLSASASTIVGSVEEFSEIKGDNIIFITQMGTSTKCVLQCRDILEKNGYDVCTFHAAGPGGECFEELIKKDIPVGVMDITTAELSNTYVGGKSTPHVERMLGAIKREIPAIICPGNLDTIVFDGPGTDNVPSKFSDREFHYHNPSVTLMRMNREESVGVGKMMAEKMNKATSPMIFVFPKKGWSEYDKVGGIETVDYRGNKTGKKWHKPDSDKAFLDSLRENIDKKNKNIEIIVLDNHLNDNKFSKKLCQYLLDLL